MIYDEIETLSEQFEDIKKEPEENFFDDSSKGKKKQRKPNVEQGSGGGISEAKWRYGKPLGNDRYQDSVTGKIYREIKL